MGRDLDPDERAIFTPLILAANVALDKCEKYRKVKQCGLALSKAATAYEKYGTWLPAVMLASAWVTLGHHRMAFRYFLEADFLARGESLHHSRPDEYGKFILAPLIQEAGRLGFGIVRVLKPTGPDLPPGAHVSVWIDGISVPFFPGMPIGVRVRPGSHRVRFAADRCKPVDDALPVNKTGVYEYRPPRSAVASPRPPSRAPPTHVPCRR